MLIAVAVALTTLEAPPPMASKCRLTMPPLTRACRRAAASSSDSWLSVALATLACDVGNILGAMLCIALDTAVMPRRM